MSPVLAYIPFIEPLHAAQTWWYLLVIPLTFGISVIYKALRMVSLVSFWREVTVMTMQILIAMIALALGLAVVVQFMVPAIPIR